MRRQNAVVAIAIPSDVRALLEAPNFVHLATLRVDGSPRNWVVRVSLEEETILVCTDDSGLEGQGMRRDPRAGLAEGIEG
jgi:hypothetical protein